MGSGAKEMSGDKEVIELSGKCKIEITKAGNITIMGDCDGKGFNRTEIKLFDKVFDDLGAEK